MDISQENEKNHKEETCNDRVKLERWQNRSFTVSPNTNTDFWPSPMNDSIFVGGKESSREITANMQDLAHHRGLEEQPHFMCITVP